MMKAEETKMILENQEKLNGSTKSTNIDSMDNSGWKYSDNQADVKSEHNNTTNPINMEKNHVESHKTAETVANYQRAALLIGNINTTYSGKTGNWANTGDDDEENGDDMEDQRQYEGEESEDDASDETQHAMEWAEKTQNTQGTKRVRENQMPAVDNEETTASGEREQHDTDGNETMEVVNEETLKKA